MNRFAQLLWQRAFVILVGMGLMASALAQEVAPTAAPKISAEQLQQWLAELDSDSFDVREAAAEKLAQAGPAAVDVLASGIVSESAEIAWRSGASLERIAMAGDEKTLARVTNVLDKLSVKGKPGLKTMAAEMHVRQKHFRHDRAVSSLKQNGAVFAGDGMEFGGGPVIVGGPIGMAMPLMIIEEEGIEVVPVIEAEPVPAKMGDGIFGLLGRIFEAVKGPEEPAPILRAREVPAIPPPVAIPFEAIPPRFILPADLKDEPVKEDKPTEPAVEEKPADEKPADIKPGEPVEIFEEFKDLADRPIAIEQADVQVLAPPPALAEAVEVVDGADMAMPIGLDFIGGGIIGIDEGEVETATSLMLGKQWRGGDDGLKVLKDVPEIWSIAVNGAKITDASLQYMAELPNLNTLQIRDTAVTRQGLKKLRESKPELQVQARGEAMMGVNADLGTSPLVLTSIFPDSGAYQAGLRQGDVIHSVDGSRIKDFADLTISIYGLKAGDKVRVEYERGGAKKTAVVTLKSAGMISNQVLISGGTSGIGRAIALAFAAEGHQVVATGVSAAEVEAANRETPGNAVQNLLLDVRSDEQIASLIGTLPRLDVLVNCAGIIRRGGAEHDPAVFAEVLDVNLTGTLRLCTAARPLLKQSRGCVLNTASMLSFFGSGVAPAYSASKGGVAQLTKSLAIAWAVDGIRVNAIAPGWIETPLTEPLTSDPARRQAIIDRTPLARWGRPEDVAGAALFLCSPAAAFITGAILPVDGGYSVA